MKRILLFLAALAVVLGVLPATAGAQAGTAQVTIVHDATYDFPDAPFPVTVCVDGQVPAPTLADFQVTDVIGPIPLPAGTYTIEIFVGAGNTACEGEAAITEDVTVAAGDNVTLAAIWPSDGGAQLVAWPNDVSCTDGARVTVRHGAATGGPVDVYAIVGGNPVPLVKNLAEGAQKSVEVPAGTTAQSVVVTAAGGETPLITVPGPLTLEAGKNYIAYAAGGADGSAGVWLDPVDIGICTTPTTPTTPTTAAPTTAPAAQAAAATPRFTG